MEFVLEMFMTFKRKFLKEVSSAHQGCIYFKNTEIYRMKLDSKWLIDARKIIHVLHTFLYTYLANHKQMPFNLIRD